MISVRELRKAYGSLVAVDGVSLEIAPHETLALLGPNGAGKTTTIHMLVGLIRPDSGEISINNAGSPDNPSVRRHIGIAPQALATYGDLTADENLRFFGRIYSLHGRKLRRRVDAALDMAGLESRRRDLVKTFSGGMQRRLHLACAILHEPQVLFLDEPTIGVDPQARNHILEAIEQLRRQGCTIILTTHYMEEAERLCDRVAIMDQGRILAMDSLGTIIGDHGGRSVVQAHLEVVPTNTDRLPGRLNGDLLVFESDNPIDALHELHAAGVRIRDLTVDRPSLETVFLTLTGRSLRD
jgi:linearmycin/streptolysin S transport system ATP-binding protein